MLKGKDLLSQCGSRRRSTLENLLNVLFISNVLPND
jgi:hypothetical protein